MGRLEAIRFRRHGLRAWLVRSLQFGLTRLVIWDLYQVRAPPLP
jgi:hypothetical protein